MQLPPEIDRFLRNWIRSVWDLEVLLLLQRDPERSWNSASLVRELRASDLIVADAVLMLQAAGLVEQDAAGDVRFRPQRPESAALVAQLREFHAKFPTTVAQAIWAAPNPKIQAFADAFRLKKD